MEFQLRELILLAGVCVAVVAVCVSVITLYISRKTNRETHAFNLDNQRNQLFLNLRDRYLTTRLKIPEKVYQPDYPTHESNDEWKHIQHYWYIVFDEWYTTTQLNKGAYEDLWEDYFGPATRSSLRYQAKVKVLESMLSGSVSFGEQKTEFIKELNRLNDQLPNTEKVTTKLEGAT